MYKYILKKFEGKNLIIKPHPRDEIDYKKIFNDSVILKRTYPIEILNFVNNISIKRCITAFSTSIDGINFCEEKIKLGYDFVEKYRIGENSGE